MTEDLKPEDVQVPEGMLDAHHSAWHARKHDSKSWDGEWNRSDARDHLAAALLWMVTEMPGPTREQAQAAYTRDSNTHTAGAYDYQHWPQEWLRMACLKPNPALDPRVQELMWNNGPTGRTIGDTAVREHNDAVAKAYELGRSLALEGR